MDEDEDEDEDGKPLFSLLVVQVEARMVAESEDPKTLNASETEMETI